MHILLPHEPQAKGVARVHFYNGRILTKYHWKTEKALEDIKALLLEMNLEPFPKHMPIKMEVTFWRRKSKWLPKRETLPFRKPDNSNFLKLIEDCLTGIVIPDDGQITTTIAKKRWSANGQGYIEISLEEDTL